jgi:hypothetical protein
MVFLFILFLSAAALSHMKPVVTGMACDSCYAQGHDGKGGKSMVTRK